MSDTSDRTVLDKLRDAIRLVEGAGGEVDYIRLSESDFVALSAHPLIQHEIYEIMKLFLAKVLSHKVTVAWGELDSHIVLKTTVSDTTKTEVDQS